MRIDCIIVEDEPLAQERIRGYLSRLPYMNLAGVFDGAIEAMGFLQSHAVDLVFLDINMGDFSGIQLLESMKLDSQVILSTAYHEFALKAERQFIFVKTEYRLERLQLDDLLYIEGMRDYRRIYTAGKQVMTLQTFGELEQAIPPGRVCRIHKSYLVALDKIDSVGRETVRIGSVELPVSDTYRKAFLAMIAG